MPMRKTFTNYEIATLRTGFARIERVLPERLTQIHTIFDGCGDEGIAQLAGAGIKFVSALAANERVRRSVPA